MIEMVVLSYALKFEYHKKIKSESIRGGMFLDSSVFSKACFSFQLRLLFTAVSLCLRIDNKSNSYKK